MGVDLIFPRDMPERMLNLTAEQKRALHTEWLAALRSGEYRQAPGALQADDTSGFCCLGVLCDLAVKRHPELDMRWDNAPYTNERKALGGVPPAELTQAISVSLFCSIVDLMNMNDTHGMSFSEIADFIEAKISFA